MSEFHYETIEGRRRCVVIIIMGVSGTGKTTLATSLAREWNIEFVEGDDLHSKENIEKMSSGRALNDQDREPWLERIRRTMEQRSTQKLECISGEQSKAKQEFRGLVITCSALKKYYRDILRGRSKLTTKEEDQSGNPDLGAQNPAISLATYIVYIKGSKELILQRLVDRKGHYMKADMLDGQFNDLESPEGEDDVIVVSAEDSIERQIEKVKEKIMDLGGEWLST